MTDSRVSTTGLQVLVKPVPSARISANGIQALVKPIPDARASMQGIQTLVRIKAVYEPGDYLRTVGSSRPLQMKWPDATWQPVRLVRSYLDEVMFDMPASYWRFDEASGPFRSSYGADTATIIGNPTRSTPGATGSARAVGFPTTSDYVQLAPTGALPGAGYRSSFSLECWFKTSQVPDNISTGSYQYLIMGSSNNADSFSNRSWDIFMQRRVGVNVGRIAVNFTHSGASNGVESAIRYDDGIWHHVVATFDGVNVRLYMDGVLDGMTPRATAVGAGNRPSIIGVVPANGGTYPSNTFPGLIDEVAVYNSVLSPARILAHYQAAS